MCSLYLHQLSFVFFVRAFWDWRFVTQFLQACHRETTCWCLAGHSMDCFLKLHATCVVFFLDRVFCLLLCVPHNDCTQIPNSPFSFHSHPRAGMITGITPHQAKTKHPESWLHIPSQESTNNKSYKLTFLIVLYNEFLSSQWLQTIKMSTRIIMNNNSFKKKSTPTAILFLSRMSLPWIIHFSDSEHSAYNPAACSQQLSFLPECEKRF